MKEKLRKLLRKSQPNFWHYVKKIETHAKNWFLCKKRVWFRGFYRKFEYL